MQIALFDERAREAHAHVRRLWARRHNALAWYDRRIIDLDSQRRNENPEPVLQATYRIEDAFHEFIGAIKSFDTAYLKEIARVERLHSGGLFHRLYAFFFRPAAD